MHDANEILDEGDLRLISALTEDQQLQESQDQEAQVIAEPMDLDITPASGGTPEDLSANAIEPQGKPGEIPDFSNINNEIDMLDLDNDNSKFQEASAAFNAIKNPSAESIIEFKKAEIKEQQRLSRLRLREEQRVSSLHTDDNDSQTQDRPIENDNMSLFCSEDGDVSDSASRPSDDPSNTMPITPFPACSDTPVVNGMKTADKKGRGGIKKQTATTSKRKAPKPQNKKAKKSGPGRVRKQKAPSKKPKKRSKEKSRPETLNWKSLFESKLVETAAENSLKPSIPKFSVKDKRKALKELVSAIPIATDTATVVSDRAAIMDAILKFVAPPKADGDGGWKHKYMDTSLFHYQLLGVAFMRNRECATTHPKGGFLCDEMGFGKTIQAIANMVDGKGPGITLIVAPSHLTSHWKSQLLKHAKTEALGSLHMHAGPQKLDSELYIKSNIWKSTGVIITTYSEIRTSCAFPIPTSNNKEEVKEWKKNCGFLHNINFHRIYLDEAHEIKNHRTKISMAVRALSAKFRWVISGTPLHNSAKELYPYLRFLRVPSIDDYESFCNKYIRDDPEFRRIKNCLRAYMLRRTHEETLFGLPILSLPGIDETIITVTFSKVERFIYNALIHNFMIKHFRNAHYNGNNRPFLVLLLKLRMFTSHLLLPQDFVQEIMSSRETLEELGLLIEQEPSNNEDYTMYDQLKHLIEVDLSSHTSFTEHPTEELSGPAAALHQKMHRPGAEENLTTCFFCSKGVADAYIFPCTHICCEPCAITLQNQKVKTMCRCGASIKEAQYCRNTQGFRGISGSAAQKKKAIGEPSNPENSEKPAWVYFDGFLMPGAKLNAIQDCVSKWTQEGKETKITIFTQFLGMVELLCRFCSRNGWGYTTISGKIPLSARDSRLDDFRNNPKTRVLISSLRTGGTGLDLTVATRCILVDLWWNEAIEQQAFCRLFRIGQEKSIQIVKICVEDTVDDRIQLLQIAKTTEIAGAMGSKVLAQRDTLPELLRLFDIIPDEDAEHGFRYLTENDGIDTCLESEGIVDVNDSHKEPFDHSVVPVGRLEEAINPLGEVNGSEKPVDQEEVQTSNHKTPGDTNDGSKETRDELDDGELEALDVRAPTIQECNNDNRFGEPTPDNEEPATSAEALEKHPEERQVDSPNHGGEELEKCSNDEERQADSPNHVGEELEKCSNDEERQVDSPNHGGEDLEKRSNDE